MVKINLQNYNARSMQVINDEFTYLLPLCVDEHTTKNIVKSIKNYRETGEKDFDDIILYTLYFCIYIFLALVLYILV